METALCRCAVAAWIVLCLTAVTGCDQGEEANDCAIDQIALYQGVKVRIMEELEPVDGRPVPIVQGRDALVRVFVRVAPGFSPKELIVELMLETGGTAVEPMVAERLVESDSVDDDLASTFNFRLAGALLSGDLALAVSLYDTEDHRLRSTWPQDGGLFRVGEGASGGPLDIVLIPIRYWVGGSVWEPETGPDLIARYRDRLYALFPVPAVAITTGEPIDWFEPVEPDGAGWSALLAAVQAERDVRGAAPTQYYYGLVNPDATLGAYCGPGCVTGFSSLAARPDDRWARAAVGIGFSGAISAGVMAHELGHAHGLGHAPCGFEGQPTDSDYPYGDGSIGVWGYDLVDGGLKDPDAHADFMGNCAKRWISDYHFRALSERRRRIAGTLNPGEKQPPQ